MSTTRRSARLYNKARKSYAGKKSRKMTYEEFEERLAAQAELCQRDQRHPTIVAERQNPASYWHRFPLDLLDGMLTHFIGRDIHSSGRMPESFWGFGQAVCVAKRDNFDACMFPVHRNFSLERCLPTVDFLHTTTNSNLIIVYRATSYGPDGISGHPMRSTRPIRDAAFGRRRNLLSACPSQDDSRDLAPNADKKVRASFCRVAAGDLDVSACYYEIDQNGGYYADIKCRHTEELLRTMKKPGTVVGDIFLKPFGFNSLGEPFFVAGTSEIYRLDRRTVTMEKLAVTLHHPVREYDANSQFDELCLGPAWADCLWHWNRLSNYLSLRRLSTGQLVSLVKINPGYRFDIAYLGSGLLVDSTNRVSVYHMYRQGVILACFEALPAHNPDIEVPLVEPCRQHFLDCVGDKDEVTLNSIGCIAVTMSNAVMWFF
jgi:hypothetical protein